MHPVSTRHELRLGNRYPSIAINWHPSELWGGGGYEGKLTLWHGADDKDEREHAVSIGQGVPLGQVTIFFDNVGYGAWEMGTLDGVGITERDLQWATLWAALALKTRRAQADGLRPIFSPPTPPPPTPPKASRLKLIA